MRKKIIISLSVLSAIVLLLSSCGKDSIITGNGTSDNSLTNSSIASNKNGSLDSLDSIKAVLKDKLQKGEKICLLYYDGPDVDKTQKNYKNYYAAKIDNVSNVSDLKKLTETVFTKSYSEKHFYKTFLEEDKKYIDVNGKLYSMSGGVGGEYNWLVDTAKIISKTENEALVEMNYHVNAASRVFDYLGQIKLKKTNNEWFINSPIRSGGLIEGVDKILNQKELGEISSEN